MFGSRRRRRTTSSRRSRPRRGRRPGGLVPRRSRRRRAAPPRWRSRSRWTSSRSRAGVYPAVSRYSPTATQNDAVGQETAWHGSSMPHACDPSQRPWSEPVPAFAGLRSLGVGPGGPVLGLDEPPGCCPRCRVPADRDAPVGARAGRRRHVDRRVGAPLPASAGTAPPGSSIPVPAGRTAAAGTAGSEHRAEPGEEHHRGARHDRRAGPRRTAVDGDGVRCFMGPSRYAWTVRDRLGSRSVGRRVTRPGRRRRPGHRPRPPALLEGHVLVAPVGRPRRR